LAWGLVLLWLYHRTSCSDWLRLVLTLLICLLTFPADWSCVAAMAVLFMGSARGDFSRQMWWLVIWSGVYALVYVLFLDPVYGLVQMATILAIPLLRCYNGSRGNCRWLGKLFYIYYPAHLVVIYLIKFIIEIFLR
jgi:hypothetical protein